MVRRVVPMWCCSAPMAASSTLVEAPLWRNKPSSASAARSSSLPDVSARTACSCTLVEFPRFSPMSATARTALAWDIEASWSAFNRTLLELLLFASAARKTSAAARSLTWLSRLVRHCRRTDEELEPWKTRMTLGRTSGSRRCPVRLRHASICTELELSPSSAPDRACRTPGASSLVDKITTVFCLTLDDEPFVNNRPRATATSSWEATSSSDCKARSLTLEERPALSPIIRIRRAAGSEAQGARMRASSMCRLELSRSIASSRMSCAVKFPLRARANAVSRLSAHELEPSKTSRNRSSFASSPRRRARSSARCARARSTRTESGQRSSRMA